ncbi:hypothetical protein HQ585_06555 [candidate division KSB1 bacterium]|nr:hypothetical protein [candidate division KSB1 bacterium]
MSKIITGKKLIKLVEDNKIIQDSDLKCVEGIKYDLRMGNKLLKSKFGRPISMSGLSASLQNDLIIEPGEMIFVLTLERLNLPNDIMATLSHKRKFSHQGILILGGLTIDPLYQGHLLIGLYNFSSTIYPLRPGKKLIAAIFHKLEESEIDKFEVPDVSIDEFPDELCQVMQNYKHITVQGLQQLLEKTQNEITNLRNELTTGRQWQKQFQESLDRHDKQIDKLISGLTEEKELRKTAETEFREDLKKIHRELIRNTIKISTIIAVAVLILSGFISIVFPKIFN